MRRNHSNNHLNMGSSNNSQSPPKVIADIINTEEDEMIVDGEFLDQEELFKKLSPRMRQADDDEEDLIDDYGTNINLQKSTDNKKYFIKGNKGHFLNEQHELSTIIEKELLTSQRRSSNGAVNNQQI